MCTVALQSVQPGRMKHLLRHLLHKKAELLGMFDLHLAPQRRNGRQEPIKVFNMELRPIHRRLIYGVQLPSWNHSLQSGNTGRQSCSDMLLGCKDVQDDMPPIVCLGESFEESGLHVKTLCGCECCRCRSHRADAVDSERAFLILFRIKCEQIPLIRMCDQAIWVDQTS